MFTELGRTPFAWEMVFMGAAILLPLVAFVRYRRSYRKWEVEPVGGQRKPYKLPPARRL